MIGAPTGGRLPRWVLGNGIPELAARVAQVQPLFPRPYTVKGSTDWVISNPNCRFALKSFDHRIHSFSRYEAMQAENLEEIVNQIFNQSIEPVYIPQNQGVYIIIYADEKVHQLPRAKHTIES